MFEKIAGKWVPVIGKEGAVGAAGEDGLQGQWLWTLSAGNPPEKGHMGVDSETPAVVTRLRLSTTDGYGAGVKAALNRIVANDVVVVRDREEPKHAALYKVTEVKEKEGGYFELTVEHLENNFSGSPFGGTFPVAVAVI